MFLDLKKKVIPLQKKLFSCRFFMNTVNRHNSQETNIIQKMIEDKRTIFMYIRKYGSLKGFKSDKIKLAKPF